MHRHAKAFATGFQVDRFTTTRSSEIAQTRSARGWAVPAHACAHSAPMFACVQRRKLSEEVAKRAWSPFGNGVRASRNSAAGTSEFMAPPRRRSGSAIAPSLRITPRACRQSDRHLDISLGYRLHTFAYWTRYAPQCSLSVLIDVKSHSKCRRQTLGEPCVTLAGAALCVAVRPRSRPVCGFRLA
jgi:hypothetical protein